MHIYKGANDTCAIEMEWEIHSKRQSNTKKITKKLRFLHVVYLCRKLQINMYTIFTVGNLNTCGP